MRDQTVEIIARGVCIKDGRILLCHSKGAKNTYLPGGHVEFRERASESLRRELVEELGIDALIGEFLGVSEHSFEQKGRPHAEVNLVFVFDSDSLNAGAAPPACEDHIEFIWRPVAELPASNLEPCGLRERIADWFRNRERAAGRLVASGDAWIG